MTGTLTMHGVSKEVTLPVQFLGFGKDPWGNEKAGFSIDVTLNRKDFGIVWNKTLDTGGALLGDEVLVSINLEAAKKKETAARRSSRASNVIKSGGALTHHPRMGVRDPP